MKFIILTFFFCVITMVNGQLFRNSFSFGVSGIYSNRILANSTDSNAISILINEKNNVEKPIYSYGAWINYSTLWNKHFFAGIGFRYNRLGYKYSFSDKMPDYIINAGYVDTNQKVISANFTDVYHAFAASIGFGYIYW